MAKGPTELVFPPAGRQPKVVDAQAMLDGAANLAVKVWELFKTLDGGKLADAEAEWVRDHRIEHLCLPGTCWTSMHIGSGNAGGVHVDDRCAGAEVLAYVCADGPRAPCGAFDTHGGLVKVFGGSVLVLSGGAPLAWHRGLGEEDADPARRYALAFYNDKRVGNVEVKHMGKKKSPRAVIDEARRIVSESRKRA